MGPQGEALKHQIMTNNKRKSISGEALRFYEDFALKGKINFLEQREPLCLHVWPSRDKIG